LVVNCLNSAVQSGVLREKVISKQKIYYANQDNIATCDERELAAMDREIADKTERLNEVNAQLKSLLNELRSLESSLTTPELIRSIDSLEIQLSEMEKQKSKLEASQDAVGAHEKKDAEQRYRNYDEMLRKRKRLAEEMISAIHENCPMKKKALLVGIHTSRSCAMWRAIYGSGMTRIDMGTCGL
uniref:Homologous-pairing protein 2 homolog n=1 Tax=Toxocara canis TaxID=6265 RepID=A0A183U3K0_TOXCA